MNNFNTGMLLLYSLANLVLNVILIRCLEAGKFSISVDEITLSQQPLSNFYQICPQLTLGSFIINNGEVNFVNYESSQ